MGQGVRGRRIVDEMSDLKEKATVSAAPMRLPLLGGRIAEEGTDSTAQ